MKVDGSTFHESRSISTTKIDDLSEVLHARNLPSLARHSAESSHRASPNGVLAVAALNLETPGVMWESFLIACARTVRGQTLGGGSRQMATLDLPGLCFMTIFVRVQVDKHGGDDTSREMKACLLLKPRFGWRLRSGVCPPSNPRSPWLPARDPPSLLNLPA